MLRDGLTMNPSNIMKYHGSMARYNVGNGVIHYAHYRLGAWCNDDIVNDAIPDGTRYNVTVPVTCVGCLAGIRRVW
jgi:hypothetical protein